MGLSNLLLCWAALLLLQFVVVVSDGAKKDEKTAKIKIVEAPALNRFPSMPSANDKVPKRRADPSPMSGPPHLQQLRDHCYSNAYHGYLYKACLFNNITQKEERAGWNRFHGVLGVWHEWIIENDTFVGMHYSTGDHCGALDRVAEVMFECSVKTELHNFTEPHTCTYHMVLATPLACFTGAMQVYHVLSPDQLHAWEELDRLYYGDELTYKGLTKRRREILVAAGLLQKEKKALLESPSPPSQQHPPPPPPTSSPSELAKCQEETKRLEELYETVKNQTLRVVSDYPELHSKISAVFFFNKGLDSSLPMRPMTGILSNATATSVPRGNGTNTGGREEGMGHQEHPPQERHFSQHREHLAQADQHSQHRDNLPEGHHSQHRGPLDTDNEAAGGHESKGGNGARRNRHLAEEQEELVDEKELEQLVADIGDDEVHANGRGETARRQEEDIPDQDINNVIDDLDLEGIV